MKSVIEEIYLGRRGNCDSIEESEEYLRVNKEAAALCEEFEKALSDGQKQVFENIHYLLSRLEAEAGLTRFKEGFRLGVLAATEALI